MTGEPIVVSVERPPKKYKVLVIANGVAGARAVTLLSSLPEFVVRSAYSLEEGSETAMAWYPQVTVCFLDDLPDSGSALLRTIKALPEAQGPYVLAVGSSAIYIDMSLGLAPDDFVRRSFEDAELVARVRAGTRVAELQHKLASRNRTLQELGLVEPSTGLLNSKGLAQVVLTERKRAEREGKPFTVLIGHLNAKAWDSLNAGWQLEKEISRAVGSVLVDNLRSSDFVGKWGDSSFLVVLPRTDYDEAMDVTGRLVGLVAQVEIVHGLARVPIEISFSEYPIESVRAD